jgi:hypothetical protein
VSGDHRGGTLPGGLRASRTDPATGLQTVTLPGRPHRVLVGYFRPVEGGWFAEHADRLPVEGTHRTRHAAAQALLDAIEAL